MLEAAGISTAGIRGALRVKGLIALYGMTLRTWLSDDTPDHARTMAALDRGLQRAERMARCVARGQRRGMGPSGGPRGPAQTLCALQQKLLDEVSGLYHIPVRLCSAAWIATPQESETHDGEDPDQFPRAGALQDHRLHQELCGLQPHVRRLRQAVRERQGAPV